MLHPSWSMSLTSLVSLAVALAWLPAIQQAPPQSTRPPGPASAAGFQDFQAGALAEAPKGFAVLSTLGEENATATPAKWQVVEDATAPSGKRVLKLAEAKNRGQVYNVLLREEAAPADVALEVKVRADGGSEDRGGGLVWRAKDVNSYYVCRWNPLEKNLRAYKVEAGRRVQLQSANIEAEPGGWHTIAVTMKGRVMEIAFDGKKAISCADEAFKDAGKVGLWTKADATTSFDDLRVAAAP